MKQKIIYILEQIVGWGLLILTCLGVLAMFVYLGATIAGGEIGSSIILFLNGQVFVWASVICCFLALVGIVKMYLADEKMMVLTSKSKTQEEQPNDTQNS